jgi:hypothetical protein
MHQILFIILQSFMDLQFYEMFIFASALVCTSLWRCFTEYGYISLMDHSLDVYLSNV